MLQHWEKYSGFTRMAGSGLLPPHNVVAYVRNSGAQTTDSSEISSKLYRTLKTAWAAVVRAGDVIVLLPGHSESVGTDSFTGSVAGTIVTGLGSPDQDDAPTLLFSGATSNMAVAVKNITLANCRLIADADNVTEAITVTAAGFKLIDCYVDMGVGATADAASFLNLSTGANDALILSNFMRATAGGLATMIKGATVVDNTRIVGNRIIGTSSSTTVAAIHISAAMTNLLIAHNCIDNQVAAGTAAMSFADVASTGLVFDNRVGAIANNASPAAKGILLAGTTTILVHFFENYFSDGALGTSGILAPVVTS